MTTATPTKPQKSNEWYTPSEDLERRDYSQKERDAMDGSDFGDPANQAFPIKVAKDVIHAAERLHNAKGDQDAIKKRIVAIAKRKGFPLPETWQSGESERSTTPDTSLDPPKDPMTIKNKPKSPEDTELERSAPSPDVLYYAPITRIDKEKREVIGTATAEIKDAHKTVIGYEASKDALTRWRGNVREMHDNTKAVGHALEVTPDSENKRIIVRARISKGAEDTWQKVLDGTLTGFSIGGKNGQWTERTIDGEKLPYLERYDAVELSLVDNPSCPGCDIKIVRADGVAGEALAPEDEAEPEVTRVPETDIERTGATISAATRDAMHTARDHSMNGAKQIMATCGCDDCMNCMNKIAEHDDNDGDIDANAVAARAAIAEIVRAEVADTLRSQIGPAIQRVNALLAHDAGRAESPDFTRNFTALSEKHDALASQVTQRNDALATQLSEALDLIKKIAEQPQGGGPLMHGVQKQLATSPQTARADDADIIRRATELGFAPPTDPQQAVKAAAALVRPIPR